MEVVCYIGLGSNLGNSVETLQFAAQQISQLASTRIIHASSIYQTAPMGSGQQPSYLNAVLAIATALSAADLLVELQRIETAMGRERTDERWQSRTLDLDILLYGKDTIVTNQLVVPHPGLHERAFVLYPLQEIDADVSIPGKGSISELIQAPLVGKIEKRLEVLLWP